MSPSLTGCTDPPSLISPGCRQEMPWSHTWSAGAPVTCPSAKTGVAIPGLQKHLWRAPVQRWGWGSPCLATRTNRKSQDISRGPCHRLWNSRSMQGALRFIIVHYASPSWVWEKFAQVQYQGTNEKTNKQMRTRGREGERKTHVLRNENICFSRIENEKEWLRSTGHTGLKREQRVHTSLGVHLLPFPPTHSSWGKQILGWAGMCGRPDLFSNY